MPFFCLVGEKFLECRFLKWYAGKPSVAVFAAEELQYDPRASFPAGEIYVREVPPPLVLTCLLDPIDDASSEVVFTTVAGSVVLRIERVQSKSMTMEMLAKTGAMAAAAQNRIQSRNREVCILLEGQPHMRSTVMVPALWWEKLKAHPAQGT